MQVCDRNTGGWLVCSTRSFGWVYYGLLVDCLALLGGGFKYFLFSPLFGEDFHFDKHIFQMGWNHQPVYLVMFFGGCHVPKLFSKRFGMIQVCLPWSTVADLEQVRDGSTVHNYPTKGILMSITLPTRWCVSWVACQWLMFFVTYHSQQIASGVRTRPQQAACACRTSIDTWHIWQSYDTLLKQVVTDPDGKPVRY